MRNRSNSPSPRLSSQGSRTPSPVRKRKMHSPSNEHYYEVPHHLVILLALFFFSNVFLLTLSIKYWVFIIPFVISILCSYITYRKIDGAALVQVKEMKKSLSSEQVSSILADKNSPFVDNHVRAKLVETTRRHK